MKNRAATLRQAVSLLCVVLLLAYSTGTPLAAQQVPPAQQAQPSVLQPLTPDQLDNLVAPIALYPDALLSQILVASTYPLELVEAGQWLQQNQNLQGQQLVDAARQQNWDPSIQALVVFPDVIARLNSNIRWTTDLGNAFLAQQADVMNAIQHLRAEARSAGQLNSNTEETIATDTQGGQTAIDIQPTNPDVMYVPEYNPVDVWGPPDFGYYPPLDYPDYGWGFGFYPGIYLGAFFGGLGWGGWGWGLNWFNCSIWLNGAFFNHFGFHGYGFGGFGSRGYYGRGGFGGGGFGGRTTWTHNPEHRLGVAYPNQQVANRFGGNFGGRGGTLGAGFGASRSAGNLAGARGALNSGVAGSRFGGNFAANRGNASAGFANGRSGGSYYAGNFANRSAADGGYRGGYGSLSGGYRGGYGSLQSTPAYRSSPALQGSFGGARTMPAYRSSPSFNAGGFRSTPSFGGTRSMGNFRGFSGGSHGFSGGGSHGGGSFHGGGGSHGGGGFHGGGGSHGGGGGSHGGGGRR